jgi:hypothetical protein
MAGVDAAAQQFGQGDAVDHCRGRGWGHDNVAA